MDKKDDIELSVVIPFYNEENNVRPVVEELRSTLENARIPFEILSSKKMKPTTLIIPNWDK